MFEQRSQRHDLFALALLALCVFLTISLYSYDPADAPSTLFFPPATAIHNSCGRSGAFVAECLFRLTGLGAYFVLLSLWVLDGVLLARKAVGEPVLRAIGWVLALCGTCTFAALALTGASPGPEIGPGGYVGAAGRGLLEMNFARAGSFVLCISVILAGLLLSTDYILVRIAALLFGRPSRSLATVGRNAILREKAKPLSSKSRPNKSEALDSDSGESDSDDESSERSPLPVRLHGKKVAEPADEDEESAELDDEEESEDEEEEESAPAASQTSGVGSRLASAFRIKNLKKEDERTKVIEELDAASRGDDAGDYELPPIDLLLPNETVFHEEHEKEVREKAKKLEKTFANFGFKVKVVEIETGPVIAQYEVELEAGLRLSKITSLADDLAIALRVPSVRIVAPIPGKNTVGIEVPNTERQLVRLREVIEETNGKSRKMRIPVYLGKDVAGNPMIVDLTTLPHLLIAGRTGTGKSVCLNSIIVSMLMSRRPDEVKMLMIDPKMVELSPYKKLPHLMHPVVTDMRKAEAILAWAVEKMEERYSLLARAGVRHISVYNQLGEEELMDRLRPENDDERESIPRNLPYIVIIADEMADLMMTSGKEVEQHIIRLAQKSRAVGIHLILATQKPTVDVITGLIKSNLPARIAFQVASRTDSRVVLDENGADKLLGNGDMLFLWPGTSTLLRGQGTYLGDDEINRVVDFVGTTEPQFAKELVQLKTKEHAPGSRAAELKSRDDLYEAAVDLVIREGRGSVSLLQRALGIGYGRGARLVDYMAEDGIVGDYNGSQAREVLITLEQWAEMIGEPDPPPPKPKRNRVLPDPAPRPAKKTAARQTPIESLDDELEDEHDEDQNGDGEGESSSLGTVPNFDSEPSDDDDGSEHDPDDPSPGAPNPGPARRSTRQSRSPRVGSETAARPSLSATSQTSRKNGATTFSPDDELPADVLDNELNDGESQDDEFNDDEIEDNEDDRTDEVDDAELDGEPCDPSDEFTQDDLTDAEEGDASESNAQWDAGEENDDDDSTDDSTGEEYHADATADDETSDDLDSQSELELADDGLPTNDTEEQPPKPRRRRKPRPPRDEEPPFHPSPPAKLEPSDFALRIRARRGRPHRRSA